MGIGVLAFLLLVFALILIYDGKKDIKDSGYGHGKVNLGLFLIVIALILFAIALQPDQTNELKAALAAFFYMLLFLCIIVYYIS